MPSLQTKALVVTPISGDNFRIIPPGVNQCSFKLSDCPPGCRVNFTIRMEILYYFKPFDTKIIIRQVDYFLFLLAVSSKYNFFHLFLIAVVNLVRKRLLRFYGD